MNSLTAGRQVALSASSFQAPEEAFGPLRGLLNTTEGNDVTGHLLAGGWVTDVQDQSQYYQVPTQILTVDSMHM